MSLQKVVLLGEGGVGKSALTIQFTQNHFIRDYDPTIENSYRKQINLDNESLILDILDTAGQEEYSVMRAQYIRSGAGFLLVYSIANRDTFAAMEEFRDQILMVKDVATFPMVLIGNKADLDGEGLRTVSSEEGSALAKKFNCPFFETSAKTRQNIEECFVQLVRDMKNRPNPFAPTPVQKKKGNRMGNLLKSDSFKNMKDKVKCVVM